MGNAKGKNKEWLGAESGAFLSTPGSKKNMALLYPNFYQVGMSNLGFQIIYREVNLRGDTACERFFLPEAAQGEKSELLSLETNRPLYAFDLVGVMLSFEPDYFNFLQLLDLAGFPFHAAERGENFPLVLVGGPCATFNPEPLALFADAFLVGEGEETIQVFLDSLYANQNLPKKEQLEILAQIPGIYVPRFYQPLYEKNKITGMAAAAKVPASISRQWVKKIDDYAGYSQVVTPNTEFSSMFILEVARGCGRQCRFCMAGYCFLPPRPRSLAKLWQAIENRPPQAKKVGLLGAAVCDYPELRELTGRLAAQRIPFSLSSLRADMLDEQLVQALCQSGQRTLTIAPEAGSERLRKVIKKGITEEDIIKAAGLALQNGMESIRLYFMLGLPTETQEDLLALAALVQAVQKQLPAKKGKLTLSINPFIPKPFTPFQWEELVGPKEFKQKVSYLRRVFAKEKLVEIKVESYKSSLVQAALARGDRRMGELLLQSYQDGGLKELAARLKATGLPSYSTKDYLPWQHLNMGFSQAYLLQEREKALSFSKTGEQATAE